MLREQAIALLKELIENNLITTTWVSIDERNPGSFGLKFRGNYDPCLLESFLQEHNLTLEENKEKEWAIMY